MAKLDEPMIIPSHVPPELVRDDYPMLSGRYVDVDPYKEIIPDIHLFPPVFYSTNAYPGDGPAWVVRRGQDLRALYLDTVHFSSAGMMPFAKLIGETWNMVPTETDAPDHSAFRTILNPLFSQRKMASMADSVRAAARQALAPIKDKDRCEFMGEFAFPFPVSVFLDLMDMPRELTPMFMAWEHDLLHESDVSVIGTAVGNVVAYMRETMADRRKNPRDDFISYGLQATVHGRPLTEDELVGYTFNLFIGGLDTVTTNMGLHFRHLAENPDHQRRLRNDPTLIPVALEELLRAYGATSTFRTCVKETRIGGVTIKPGDKVLMSPITACRDPELYERPNEILLDRKPAHVTFAYGPHVCIGLHLARRELQVALEEFLAAIPEFEIEPGANIRTHLGGMVQPVTLPLTWGG